MRLNVAVEEVDSPFSQDQIGFLCWEDPIDVLSGNLPHWRQDCVTYFVTFRTADSLPREKLTQWFLDKEKWLREHPEPHDEKTKQEYTRIFSERIQKYLDNGYGDCLLARPDLKAVVKNGLKFFDGDRYYLGEYVVMPNHVHVVLTPIRSYQLSHIIQSLKSFSAKEINKRIGKQGIFWQKESFDHIVRTAGQLKRIEEYIRRHIAYEKM